MLLDAHIHLQDIKDREVFTSLLAQGQEQGVDGFFCNATSPSDWESVRDMAAADERIVSFFGIHPWNAERVETGWERLLSEFCAGDRRGIGEIGLDRARNEVDFGKQKEMFIRQVDIACSLHKPFAVHCVRAWDVLIPILRSKDLRDAHCMIHAFSGSQDDVRALIDLGAYFSFRVLQNISQAKRRVFMLVPLERLFLETDFPYLAVPPENGRAGADEYFAYIRALYAEAAQLRGIDLEQLIKVIWENGTVFAH